MGLLDAIMGSAPKRRRGRKLPKIPKGLARRARKVLKDAEWKKKVADRKAEIKALQKIANRKK